MESTATYVQKRFGPVPNTILASCARKRLGHLVGVDATANEMLLAVPAGGPDFVHVLVDGGNPYGGKQLKLPGDVHHQEARGHAVVVGHPPEAHRDVRRVGSSDTRVRPHNHTLVLVGAAVPVH